MSSACVVLIGKDRPLRVQIAVSGEAVTVLLGISKRELVNVHPHRVGETQSGGVAELVQSPETIADLFEQVLSVEGLTVLDVLLDRRRDFSALVTKAAGGVVELNRRRSEIDQSVENPLLVGLSSESETGILRDLHGEPPCGGNR